MWDENIQGGNCLELITGRGSLVHHGLKVCEGI